MEVKELRKEIVQVLLDKKLLISKDIIEKVNSLTDFDEVKLIVSNLKSNFDVLKEDNVLDFFKVEKKIEVDKKVRDATVEIIQNYKEDTFKKREVNDFTLYFRNRYKSISNMLRSKSELDDCLSINRIVSKKESMRRVSLIGIVFEISETKNGHIMLEVEDLTGKMKVIITKKSQDAFNAAKDLVRDEIIGIVGSSLYDEKYKSTVVFCNSIIHPDVPMTKELKKCPDEVYSIFLSDIHVGSIDFLPEEFDKFVNFLNGDCREEYKDKISKIRYLFIAGDLVEGIGIYPGQDEELNISDIFAQYEEFAKYIARVPKHIKVIICPGNHDALRLAEPQPPIPKDMAPDLYSLDNVYMVSNPSLVNIHKSEEFEGFDVLLYHGYSFDYYISNVDSIRNAGGYHRADLVMEFFLKRRHLCPTHTSTPYIPNTMADPLVISRVPDFFVTGHIHYSKIAMYNNVTLICGSCWQKATSFQLKLGHDPEPARVPLVNLRTRKVDLLIFGDENKDDVEGGDGDE